MTTINRVKFTYVSIQITYKYVTTKLDLILHRMILHQARSVGKSLLEKL